MLVVMVRLLYERALVMLFTGLALGGVANAPKSYCDWVFLKQPRPSAGRLAQVSEAPSGHAPPDSFIFSLLVTSRCRVAPTDVPTPFSPTNTLIMLGHLALIPIHKYIINIDYYWCNVHNIQSLLLLTRTYRIGWYYNQCHDIVDSIVRRVTRQ